MKKLYYLFALLLLVSCGEKKEAVAEKTNTPPPAEIETTKDNMLTADEVADGWKLLFDGKSIEQWRGYNMDSFPTKGWEVRNGELIVEYSGTEEAGFGGDIITKTRFENFELKIDFALSDTSNSGIFYLVKEVEDTPIWHNAPEFQLLDDETYKKTYEGLTNKQLTGANYDLHAQKVNYSRPIGEWNTAHIIKNGTHVQHFLNDSLVVAYQLYDEDWQQRYEASKFSEYPDYAQTSVAPIGLQDHGHLCRFKNIKIKPL